MTNTLYRPAALFVFLALTLAGCATHIPSSDTTPPEVTITVRDGRGDNVFKSADGEYAAGENCIKVPDTPTRLTAIAGDSGGVRILSIKVLPGNIVPESVEITPASPESSYSIRSEEGVDILNITLEPSPEGIARTAITAVFDVSGELPSAVTASAGDHSGNVSHLPQFDIRELTDLTVCRGE